jgi:hypothetical protein
LSAVEARHSAATSAMVGFIANAYAGIQPKADGSVGVRFNDEYVVGLYVGGFELLHGVVFPLLNQFGHIWGPGFDLQVKAGAVADFDFCCSRNPLQLRPQERG